VLMINSQLKLWPGHKFRTCHSWARPAQPHAGGGLGKLDGDAKGATRGLQLPTDRCRRLLRRAQLWLPAREPAVRCRVCVLRARRWDSATVPWAR
jgi:hypothetical protein